MWTGNQPRRSRRPANLLGTDLGYAPHRCHRPFQTWSHPCPTPVGRIGTRCETVPRQALRAAVSTRNCNLPRRFLTFPFAPCYGGPGGSLRRWSCFCPVGAAVRLAAPLLSDKRSDPALVCVDDAGRYAVSVLSGHLGGADRLAERVAAILGAEAVVTSGSHATRHAGRRTWWALSSVGLFEADSVAITRASAAVVKP